MEKIDLPDKKISDDTYSPPRSPKESMHLQSLLHAVSNKEKVRGDIDDVEFMKEANKPKSANKFSRPPSPPSRKISPVNIFSHLKNLSEQIEAEDHKQTEKEKTRSPSVIRRPKIDPVKENFTTPPSPKPPSPQNHTNQKNYLEEKALLLQSYFLLQQQGVKSDLKLDMSADFTILKGEVIRMQTELNSQKMIKFMRKGLIAFVSGLEFLNNRYDPVGLHLNGFSEHCMTSLGDYDSVFMRLYDKYKDRTQALAPEVELLLLLLGSMMMFHLTQQFVQQSMPQFTKKKKPQARAADSDDDDMESVVTDNFIPTKSTDHQKLPTDFLSTPAFPAMIQKLVENQPRPQFQPPRKAEPKMESIDEVKEFEIDTNKSKKIPRSKDTKDEQVLVLG